MSQEDNIQQIEKKEDNSEQNNEQIKEIPNTKNELTDKINEMNNKFLTSKNNFIEKIKQFNSQIISNYDTYISNITQNSKNLIEDNSKNEEDINQYLSSLENIFNNLEELQNKICEDNENLNNFFNQKDKEKDNKKKKEENKKILKINYDVNINECQKKLEENNIKNIEKIIIEELSSNLLEEIFLPKKDNNDNDNDNEKNDNININKQFKDIIIKKCNLENINLSQLFPNVNKFKLKKCQLSFNSKNFFNFNTINELYLENINLVNESFNIILSDLKNNINFINNIKVFSIKSNKISIFNLNFGDNNANSGQKYNNLEILNLTNNKISKINNNIFDLLPSIKIIDLTNNNISFNSRYKNLLDISKTKNCLFLLSKNPGIIKEKNREEYCNYLKEIFPSLPNDYPIKNLNFEGLFCGKTFPLLSEINISNTNKNLIILNLSYNNLNDQEFIKLIENYNSENSIFSGIKKLILCSNYITEEGLDNLINKEYNKIFNNLVKLDLSGNPLKYNDLEQFKKFINGFPKLKTLLIRHTPFEKDFNDYLKIRVIRKMEENEKNELSNMSEMDLQFDNFIEKEHYLKEKTKLKLKLMNTSGHKCLSMIRKYFPYLLENIKIETKFMDEDRMNRIIY